MVDWMLVLAAVFAVGDVVLGLKWWAERGKRRRQTEALRRIVRYGYHGGQGRGAA